MKAEVISTGTEILRGRSFDTNGPWIARRLDLAGYDVRFFSAYADDREEITEGLRRALSRAQVVVMTGGLGPTSDDHTRLAVAAATRLPQEFRPEAWERIVAFHRRFGRRPPRISRRQAYFPRGAEIIENPVGTAPGFFLRHRGACLAALSGVPSEMKPMLDLAIGKIQAALPPGGERRDASFHIAGVPEVEVERIIYPPLSRIGNLEYGITARAGVVSLHLRARGTEAEEVLNRCRALVRRRFGRDFFAEGEMDLARNVAQELISRGITIAIAESCTGGIVASQLTEIAGVSQVFLEGLVTYSNEAKRRRLGVKEATLNAHGAVSAETAREMAQGVRRTARADVGLAITGIAGPSGGTRKKPVGLVYLGISTNRRTRVEKRVFPGDRHEIRRRAADHALLMVRREIETLGGGPQKS